MYKMKVESEVELGKAILDEMGIYIGPNNMLIDQDTNAPVQFQGKTIRYTTQNPAQLYIGEGDVLFDPVHNFRMIHTMMGLYAEKCAQEGKEVLTMYDNYDRETKKNTHTIKFSAEDKVESREYRNKCLAYCDNILEMANYDSNLTAFDDVEEVK